MTDHCTPDEVVNVVLGIAYDGSAFNGWAFQPGLPTVQGFLERALFTLFRQQISLTVAGRTDAGVHASAQVANFTLRASAWQALSSKGRPAESVLFNRLRVLLGRDDYGSNSIVIRSVQLAPVEFDARFCALRRHYVYTIACRPEFFDPLERNRQWWLVYDLDVDAMNLGAKFLLGEHDFAAFCKSREGASTVRTLEKLEVKAQDCNSSVLKISVSADAFCHSMVRSLVGALTEVGRGKRSQAWLESCLTSSRRICEIPVAPASGLTLSGVDYPPFIAEVLKAQSQRTRRFRG